MDLLDRTIRELKDESAFISQHLQGWWGGMTVHQQAFTLGTACAALLLIGLLYPTPKSPKKIETHSKMDRTTAQMFFLSAVVLVVMTLGLDMVVENF